MGASIAEHDLDDDSDFAESHEINVTPFIDVVLVLLIIFMVAAPLSTVDLPIDLPTSTATPQKKPDKPTYVSIKPDLSVAIGENMVKRVDLVRSLDAMPDSSKERHVFLRADRAVPYGELMDVLEILRAGGYSTNQAGGARRRSRSSGGASGAGKALTGLDEQKPSRRLWISAAVIALALHIGGAALAIAHLQTEEADDALGASAIEIGLEMASVRREVTDLPPGPDTDASAASPQLAEQKAEVKETELPQDKPTEPEEADRVVTENESKKPEEDDPKIAAVQTQASTESVASEATATPSSEDIPEGQRSIAPVIGTGESARRARATWQKELVAHLDKHKRYPKERQQKSAEIQIRFTLDRMGRVLSTDIEKGSGDPAFDEAALAMVRRSDPVPMPPPVIADEGLTFTLPVIFRVKNKS
ncbi:TonB system transport protein ExbD (group 1) [Bradyrhizobium sp. AZCC 1719]